MKYYSISNFAKQVGISPQSLRLWDKSGTFKPDHRTFGNNRKYSEAQVEEYFNLCKKKK